MTVYARLIGIICQTAPGNYPVTRVRYPARPRFPPSYHGVYVPSSRAGPPFSPHNVTAPR
ncbi:hypothetical protein SDD30_01630 [Moorella naiadis]